jgi:hypothetical protein
MTSTSPAASIDRATAEAAAEAPLVLCTNCGLPRTGEYCAACGQRAVNGRLTVRGITQQVAQDVLNLDRGILFTALELTRRPGDAIREYVDGRRVRYTGPVKYFVLTVALTTFATTQLGVMDEVAAGLTEGLGSAPPVSAGEISGFMSQWMTLFMALGVPFTAAVTHRLFSRARMTYAEHLALNLYSYGHQCLGMVVAVVLGALIRQWEAGLLIIWLFASPAYFAWTCTRFFRMRPLRAVPLGLLGIVLGTLAYFSAAAFVIGLGVGLGKVVMGG